MDILSVLEQFGLENKENQVYLACLELGTASVFEIAIKANIKRTTVYDVLRNLMNKGLIVQTQKGKKRLFYAEPPEKLYSLIEEKKKKLDEIVPILKSFYNTAGTKPKIRYYEGKDGLKEVFRDTLNFEGSILGFTTENILDYFDKDFDEEYMAERTRKKIFFKVIGADTEEIRRYRKDDKKYFKKTKLVPKEKFPFSVEMNIYGNRIAFLSYKEEMGIIIESKEIADNMRFLFNLSWESKLIID